MNVRLGVIVFVACGTVPAQPAPQSPPGSSQATPRRRRRAAAAPVASARAVPFRRKAFVNTYCVTCHNQRLKTGGLALDTLDVANVGEHAAEWEKVVVKLRAGLMPPSGVRRPAQTVIDEFTVVARGGARSRRRGRSRIRAAPSRSTA